MTWRLPVPGESLADYLGEARRTQGATWDEMVRRTRLSLGTIRKIEEGRTKNPGVFTLLQLWEALDLPIDGLPVLHESHGVEEDGPDDMPHSGRRRPELRQ